MSKPLIRPFVLTWLMWAMAGTTAAQTVRRASPPAAPAEPRPTCVVAEFKGIGLHTHEPQERLAKATQWLQRNGSACTLAQAITIASNRATWLGTADTPLLMARIDGLVESRQNAADVAAAAATAPAAPAAPAASTAPQPKAAGPAA